MSNIAQYVFVTSEMLGWMKGQPTPPPGINEGQAGFGLYVQDATELNARLGQDYSTYRLGGWQLGNQTQFSNGQWWKLEAYIGSGDPTTDMATSSWKTIYSQMTPKQDLVSNLGIGDDYIVFASNDGSGHLMLSLDAPFGEKPISLTYTGAKPGGTGAPTFEEAKVAYAEATRPAAPEFTCRSSIQGSHPNGSVSRDDHANAGQLRLNHSIRYDNALRPALERVEVVLRYTDINGIERVETHLTPVTHPTVTQTADGYDINGAPLKLHHTPRANVGPEPEIEIVSVISYFEGGYSYASPGPFQSVDVICFAAGSLVQTARGLCAVEMLKAGDLVMTKDHGLQPLLWAGQSDLSAADFAQKPKLRPIRLRAQSLGKGLPQRNMLISAQHRVFVDSPIAERMVGPQGALIAAKHLVGLEGIEVAQDIDSISYIHLLFDRHEVIYAEAAAFESLLLGKMALDMLSPKQRGEVLALRPEAKAPEFNDVAAAPILSGAKARKLVERHQKNQRALQSPAQEQTFDLIA